ncbi:MAG: 3'-5' exonuclease [Acidobacteriota bacterium]
MKILALDFETADYQADSACALGLAMIEDGTITRTHTILIRPPRRYFQFTYIHGITWEDVKDKPTFAEHWEELARWFEEADFLVAHNAPFDRGVLRACCLAAGVMPPSKPFLCTVRLSRSLWQLKPAALPNVCEHFGIGLNHHDAGSDTLACARIMIHALASIAGGGAHATPDHLSRYVLRDRSM